MLKNIKIVQYFGGIIVAFWVSFGALALLAWLGLGSAANSLHEVHGNRMRKADQLAQMADQATRNRMEVLLMFQHDPSGQLAGVHDHATTVHLDTFAKRRTEIERLWTAVREGQPDEAEQTLIQQVDAARQAWRIQTDAALQAVQQGSFAPEVMAKYLAAGRTEGDAEVRLTQRQTSIKTLEWEHIHEALAAADFNISEAARQLGMHRRTLARKLEKQRVK